MQQMNNNQLLQRVYEASFAVDDAALFLDSHPYDQNALAYFQYVLNLRKEAVEAYEASYGPLLIDNAGAGDYWNWIDDPWPWEGACN